MKGKSQNAGNIILRNRLFHLYVYLYCRVSDLSIQKAHFFLPFSPISPRSSITAYFTNLHGESCQQSATTIIDT